MNLEKYYTFLNMFKYINKESRTQSRAYYKIESIECPGCDQIDEEGNIYNDSWVMRTMKILITEDDEEIINDHIKNFNSNLVYTKNEILNNLYSILQDKDRIHFLNFIISDVFTIVNNYISTRNEISTIYKDSNSRYLISAPFVIYYDLFLEYFDKHCYQALVAWLKFIDDILKNLNTATKYRADLDIIKSKISQIYKALLIFDADITIQIEETQRTSLKDYFKDPNKYNKIIELDKIQKMFDKNGIPLQNTPKWEIGSFLRFLNDRGFLLKVYATTKELPDIAHKLYQIKYDYLIKQECRRTEDFSFILDFVNP